MNKFVSFLQYYLNIYENDTGKSLIDTYGFYGALSFVHYFISMLIILANELDTTVSELLGEPIAEPTTDDLKILSEKLEVINLQLAKRSITKVKTIRWILISLCAVIVVIFIALASTNSFYLNWNYNDPELAVAGTILHGFEFLFVRLAPIVFLTSVVGVVVTYKKR